MNEAQISETLATLERLAPVVQSQHDDLKSAVEDERTAEAQLLARIVDAVRPALRALSSRLKASERVFWPDRVSTATEKSYHAERGVLVDGTGPEQDHPRANEGAIVGKDLVLLEDGLFARLDWSGNWTRWQGRTSEETSALTRLTCREVVEEWDAEEVAASLAERLQEHADGKSAKTAAASQARAERLRSVANLLGGER